MSIGARFTACEAALERLISARAGRVVGAALREARRRVQAGETAPARVCDIVELEREAARPGLLGRIA